METRSVGSSPSASPKSTATSSKPVSPKKELTSPSAAPRQHPSIWKKPTQSNSPCLGPLLQHRNRNTNLRLNPQTNRQRKLTHFTKLQITKKPKPPSKPFNNKPYPRRPVPSHAVDRPVGAMALLSSERQIIAVNDQSHDPYLKQNAKNHKPIQSSNRRVGSIFSSRLAQKTSYRTNRQTHPAIHSSSSQS